MPLVVHENFRLEPWYREAKRLIDAGTLGALHAVAFRLRPGDGQGPRAYLDRQPYFQQMPRFLVVETAIHWIDTFRFLMGEVAAVYARLRRVNPVIAGEDAGYIVFEFDERRDRTLRRQPPQRPRRRQPAAHDGRDVARGVRRRAAARRRRAAVVEAAPAAPRPSTPTTAVPTTRSAAAACEWLQRHVVAHLRAGAPLENTARDYLANLRVQEAVYRSRGEGRRIELADLSTAARRSGDAGAVGPTWPTHHGGTHETQTVRTANRWRRGRPCAGFAVGAQAQTVLKFSHTDQPGGARQKAAEMFAQKVEQYTQGRYKVQVFPAGQLANDPKAVEQLQLGGIDFTVTRHRHVRDAHPDAQPDRAAVPGRELPAGLEAVRRVEVDAGAVRQGSGEGLPLPVTFEAGFRSMTTKEPLASPADAKGKKLRSFPNEMMRWQLEAMGFNVQIMPLPEVYLAIQQGAVSGQENPIDTIYANKFYEVAPYVTLTQHVYSPIPLTISEKTWQKLSPADREAVHEGGEGSVATGAARRSAATTSACSPR